MSLAGELCYRLARRIVLKRDIGDDGAREESFDRGEYQNWRKAELESQYKANFSTEALAGKSVLDFGAGGGELSFFALESGAADVTGVEVDPDQYAISQRQVEELEGPRPNFLLADRTDAIPTGDAQFDAILCFDVLEHILDYEAIIPEWRRVLKPGGKILIWWMPYYHPYGHHVESLVPVPWAHAIFPEKAVIEACAKVYDMPEFKPRIWDLDENGEKKPNKWLSMKELPTLNKLTIRRFEKLAAEAGLVVDRKEYQPITSSAKAEAVSKQLIKTPLKEYFTSVVIYELSRPAADH